MADHGIREAVFGSNMRDIDLILENIACLELLRRGYKVTVGRTENREIDFVCDKSGESCMFRLPICWHPMKPCSVSSAHMAASAVFCCLRNGMKRDCPSQCLAAAGSLHA